jgi:NAD(P)-dependent dehydrogenase (short-subunit alcohol dehydrogenase family)
MKRATLITGASKGIGLACAILLAERGHTVVGLARNATDSRFPGELHLVDLADRHALAAALVALTDRYQFNGLVNNVGYVTPQTLEVVDLAAYDRTFEVNATSAMLCAQALLPGMQAQQFGRIVNIASEVVLGMTKRTAYAAAKAVLMSFTRTWALELAGHGITVNSISPGPVDTEFFAANNPSGSAIRQSKVDRIPRGRIGLPSDISNAVGFFMLAESEFVTGQNLYVCGGSSLGSSSFL